MERYFVVPISRTWMNPCSSCMGKLYPVGLMKYPPVLHLPFAHGSAPGKVRPFPWAVAFYPVLGKDGRRPSFWPAVVRCEDFSGTLVPTQITPSFYSRPPHYDEWTLRFRSRSKCHKTIPATP